MKNTLETLKTIDASKFYCITLWERTLQLQGKATSETIDYCKSIGITNFNAENGHLNAKKNNIEITLTF
jgi:hypothetical protein